MDARRLAPLSGIVACLAAVAVVLAPYVLLSSAEASGVGVYYGQSVVGPPVVALFGLVGTIVFAAGLRGRSDPGVVAGTMLVVGLAAALAALQWAFAVSPELVASIAAAPWLSSHRWLLVLVAAAIPVSAAWYARAIGVV